MGTNGEGAFDAVVGIRALNFAGGQLPINRTIVVEINSSTNLQTIRRAIFKNGIQQVYTTITSTIVIAAKWRALGIIDDGFNRINHRNLLGVLPKTTRFQGLINVAAAPMTNWVAQAITGAPTLVVAGENVVLVVVFVQISDAVGANHQPEVFIPSKQITIHVPAQDNGSRNIVVLTKVHHLISAENLITAPARNRKLPILHVYSQHITSQFFQQQSIR